MQHSLFRNKNKQSGAAVLVFVLLIVTFAATLLITKLNRSSSQLYRDEVTMKALQKAKTALLGYAVSYPDLASTTVINAGPGYLPCPDDDYPPDGSPDSCSAFAIGRLPWEFIGLDEIRDSAGEPLWYLMADDFKNIGSGRYYPINSETPADTDLIVDTTTEVIAVIIAPGFSFAGQNRPSANVGDYLEGDNSNNDASFVTQAIGEFNDQLLTITRQELMQAIEKRVLGEVAKINRRYATVYDDNGLSFPYLSSFRNPRLSNSISDENVTLISGVVEAGTSTSLTDSSKDFLTLAVSTDDVVNVFNSTTNKSEHFKVVGVSKDSLTLEAITSGFTTSSVEVSDNYTVSRFNATPGETLGTLAIQSDQEAFYSPAKISWANLNGTISECSQLDATPNSDNEASAHISHLRAAINTQTEVDVNRLDNICVWTNENQVNCSGTYDVSLTEIGLESALASIELCNPAEQTEPIGSASKISRRVISYRLNYRSINARIKTYTGDGSRDTGLIGEKVRVASTSFPNVLSLLPTIEIVIEDFSDDDDLLGRISVSNPSSVSLTFENRQIALAPMSGYATGGGATKLIDTTKDFIARGVRVGDWLEKVERTNDIVNNEVGDLRGFVTALTSSQITFNSKGTGGNALSFADGDEYRIYHEFPKWFTYNNWHHLNLLAYSADKLPGATGSCSGGNCLSVGASDLPETIVVGNDNKDALVISAGSALAGQDRSTGDQTDYYDLGNQITSDEPLMFDRGAFDNNKSLFNDQIKIVAPCATEGNEIHDCY